ncbi:protein TRACHEARY ELEMENT DIFFERENTIATION-RELATED 7A-like [Apium graveolens]|uniref:protein TRACHEARY ELEMENT DIFFERENTIATION-RELATED 7A-like n=1 Tax=Apium graveolens TaxID=4045 RepID=UPI003D7B9127
MAISTVIVVVFVCLGGLCLLAFVPFALCCFLKCRKKKTTQEADHVHVDEHMNIKEKIVEGPLGGKAVVLTIEDDVHVEEEIRKNEQVGRAMNTKSKNNNIVGAESSSSSGHHQVEHKP